MSFWRKIKIKLKNRWNDYNYKKIILLILFWISILGLFIGVELASFLSKITNDLTELKYMWILLLFLPLPILSIKLGKKYKKIGYHCQKNIIGGFIMIFFYIIYACFTFMYFANKDRLLDDYTYLTKLEEKINFDFPNQGKILTDKIHLITNDNYKMIAISTVDFENKKEIETFEQSIKQSNIWTNSKSSYLQIIKPTFYTSTYDINDYYLIYIDTLNTINTIPTSSGTYKAYYLNYDYLEKKLFIYEYYLFLTL